MNVDTDTFTKISAERDDYRRDAMQLVRVIESLSRGWSIRPGLEVIDGGRRPGRHAAPRGRLRAVDR